MTRRLFAIAALFIQAAACSASVETGEPEVEPASSSEAPLLGSDACKNVDITVANSVFYDGKDRDIRVDYVKYYSASEGDWYTQSLGNVSLKPGQKHTWENKDLQHAENDRLTKWRVYFNIRESDGDWSDLYYEEIDTPDETCEANDKFSLTVN